MDAYGTFDPHHHDTEAPSQTASGRPLARAAGAAGVVLLALGAFSGQFSVRDVDAPLHEHLSMSTSPSSGLSDAEQSFLSGISRDRMKEFLHAYSR
jgi:hypothetical protein